MSSESLHSIQSENKKNGGRVEIISVKYKCYAKTKKEKNFLKKAEKGALSKTVADLSTIFRYKMLNNNKQNKYKNPDWDLLNKARKAR